MNKLLFFKVLPIALFLVFIVGCDNQSQNKEKQNNKPKVEVNKKADNVEKLSQEKQPSKEAKSKKEIQDSKIIDSKEKKKNPEKKKEKKFKDYMTAKKGYALALKMIREGKQVNAFLLLQYVANNYSEDDYGIKSAERILTLKTTEQVNVQKSCPACLGQGIYRGRCLHCKGSGASKCEWRATGTGWLNKGEKYECRHGFQALKGFSIYNRNIHNEKKICPNCGGKSFVQCYNCGGSGSTDGSCKVCKGSKNINATETKEILASIAYQDINKVVPVLIREKNVGQFIINNFPKEKLSEFEILLLLVSAEYILKTADVLATDRDYLSSIKLYKSYNLITGENVEKKIKEAKNKHSQEIKNIIAIAERHTKNKNFADARENFLKLINIEPLLKKKVEKKLHQLLEQEIRDIFIKADMKIKANKFDEARILIKSILEIDKSKKREIEKKLKFAKKAEVIFFYKLGNKCFKENKFQEARKAYKKALFHLPKSKKIAQAMSRLNKKEIYTFSREINAHEGIINAIEFSYNGKLLASGSSDTKVKLWSTQTGELLRTISHRKKYVYGVAFSPDNKDIAICGYENPAIMVHSVNTGFIKNILHAHNKTIASIKFTPNGTAIASASWDKTIKLLSVKSSRAITVFKGHKDWVYNIDLSSDGKLMSSTGSDKTIKIWSLNNGNLLKTITTQDNDTCLNFSPDNRTLVTAGHAKIVKLYSIPDGKILKKFAGHKDRVTSVSFSPNGKLLASSSTDKTVKLWNINDGRCIRTLKGFSDEVYCVKFSPDGKFLATAGKNIVKLWELVN